MQRLGDLLNKVKIVGVVRYISTLTRDLTTPGRLAAERSDRVKRLLALVWPDMTWKSFFEKGRGGRQVFFMALLSLVRTWMMNATSNVVSQLTHTVYTRDRNAFLQLAKTSALLTVVGSATSALYTYNKDTLALLWRERLTRVIHASYFSSMSYYHAMNLSGRAAIRDTDVRVSREIVSVSTRLANLISLLLTSLPPLFWFTVKLWRQKGFLYAMLPHFYLLLAYEAAQRLFPKNIGILWRNKAIAGGMYAKAATRLQTHSESIVALGGNAREKEILSETFSKVEEAQSNLHSTKSKFDLIFKLAYTYGCRSWITSFMMLPTLLSPPSLASQGDSDLMGAEIGAIRSNWQFLLEMLVANGNLLNLHATAEHMGGTCKRILTLIDTMKELQTRYAAQDNTTIVEGDEIAFEGVQVFTPDNVHLVKDLSFRLPRGGSLLLTGHNGAGKSSIFRCLGGLWKVPEGRITKPGASCQGLNKEIYYLPQKPYNVLGTLRDQLTYPQPRDQVQLSQADLAALLTAVELDHLLGGTSNDAGGATDDHDEAALINWEDKLSLGEQQRLAMARLFYHKPSFAILDECTSAVSVEMERRLYDRCKELKITYITICHRPALKQYHDTNLNLTGDGKGGWEFLDIDHADDPVHPTRDVRDDNTAAATLTRPRQASTVERLEQDEDEEDEEEVEEISRETRLERRSERYQNLAKPREPVARRGNISKLWMMSKIMIPGSRKKLLLLCACIGLRTLCHEGYSFLVGRLFRAMVDRDVKTFAIFSLLNVGQDLTTAVVEETVVYLQNLIGAHWHSSLATYITDKVFRGNAFYTLRNLDKRVTDLDQRLTSEASELSAAFSEIWAKAITPVVDVLWFSLRLYAVVGTQGMTSMAAFVAFSFVVLQGLMPDHEKLDSRRKVLESRFKFVHSRLCTHAESVAFFGGGQAERGIADRALDALVKQGHKVQAADARYKFAFACLNKDFDAPSSLINTPDLVTCFMQLQHADRRGNATASSALATESFYVKSAAERTLAACGKLTNLYESTAKLLGSSARVCEMLDVMDQLHAAVEEEASDSVPVSTASASDMSTAIALRHVDVVTPVGMCLASDLNVSVANGEGLLVTGPNCVGKTSFFRVLAGLWPLRKGLVTPSIIRPPAHDLVLVPQRVYSVTGTLADQVTYPVRLETRTAEQESKMLEALRKVGISFLVEREKGGWDAKKPWEDTLSLGEQQRMGLARLLFHVPQYGVLDECTDAVSVDGEIALYEALNAAGISCITISKRLALAQFHAQELQLGADNARGWVLKPI